jgi:hypothetical protein
VHQRFGLGIVEDNFYLSTQAVSTANRAYVKKLGHEFDTTSGAFMGTIYDAHGAQAAA